MFGRELTCRYGSESYGLWPTYSYCEVSSVYLSERYKTIEHSFSGTPEQKAAATVVKFVSLPHIRFLPTQMLNDFPRLNGIRIWGCQTLRNISENFFVQEFNVIQYLSLYNNEIATIEPNAFQHLPKLKWIELSGNRLRSLPHQLFKNNPELIAIGLFDNKINSITPDFFKNLNKLQSVFFGTHNKHQCTEKNFGCLYEFCLVSQVELDSELTTCFDNCLNSECAEKSGKLENWRKILHF